MKLKKTYTKITIKKKVEILDLFYRLQNNGIKNISKITLTNMQSITHIIDRELLKKIKYKKPNYLIIESKLNHEKN